MAALSVDFGLRKSDRPAPVSDERVLSRIWVEEGDERRDWRLWKCKRE